METPLPSSHDTTAEALTTTRQFVRVRPTTDAVHPQDAATAFQNLHTLSSTDDGGWLTDAAPPTVEMYLLTQAGARHVDYLFAVRNGNVDTLDGILDRCFPNTYEVTHESASLADALTRPTAAIDGATTARSSDGSTSARSDGGAAEPTDSPPPATTPLTDRSVAGLELYAVADQPGDWRTRLTEFDDFHEPEATESATWPLAAVITALSSTDTPIVFQTLLQPMPDWSGDVDEFVEAAKTPSDHWLVDLIYTLLWPEEDPEIEQRSRDELPPTVRDRIDELEAVNARRSFTINTRAIAFGDPETGMDPATALADLEDAFTEVGHTTYQITPALYETDSRAAQNLRDELATGTVNGVTRGRALAADWPIVSRFTSPAQPKIIADPTTAGSFCFFGGAALPDPASRAVGTRPGERTGLPLPPATILDRFRQPGYELGIPQTSDRTATDTPIALQPTDQTRHMLLAGQTGHGKSLWAVPGLLSNHAVTDGATIIFEPKDGDMADDYCRAHYAEYGSLENVYRFDAHETIPAAPFFDIRPQLEAGIARDQAVEDVADHTAEVLKAIMGPEQYDRAIESPAVIEALVKALFDPVHGADWFTLADLQEQAHRFETTGHPPAVTDEQLRTELQRIAANSEDTFAEIMAGAARRIAQAALDSRIAPLFNYGPDAADTGETTAASDSAASSSAADTDTAAFDWRDKLDEDCVIIVDMSDLRQEPQRALTITLLSQLWTALHRRDREADDPPLANIHIEEVADVAAADVLADLLQKGRSFGVGLTLSLQYPAQLEERNERVYSEAANNTVTVISGRIEDDPGLARRFATDTMAPADAANRLRGLAPGEWLVSLPAVFGDDVPRPFLVESGPRPPGHPAGPAPLSEAASVAFKAARTRMMDRSRTHGVELGGTPAVRNIEAAETESNTAGHGTTPVDTTLPYTRRLPESVTYERGPDTVSCSDCGTRHGKRRADLVAAIDCCAERADSVPADLDRVDVPAVHVGLSLSPGERDRQPYSARQLVCLQVIYNAHQQRYEPLEYDIVWDDMDALLAYTGISEEAFEELLLDGLVAVDTDQPHTLYTVTADGRDVIQAAHREGRAHGDGVGDLSESSYHVMMVAVAARVFRQRLVADPDHAATEVRTYYPVEDGRLDVAVLDDDGQIRVAAEAERTNNDLLRAAPHDYDKMAACDPDCAVWLAENREAGHEIIQALHDPLEGEPRVEKTYSSRSPLYKTTIDQPGFTEIYAASWFRNEHLGGEPTLDDVWPR